MISSAAARCFVLLALFVVRGATADDGHQYWVQDLKSGNFSLQTVSLSPVDSGSDWAANDVAEVSILGTTSKTIQAGTFKYQIYETEVKSFIASGDSPYFVCDNKGCDPSKAVALRFKNATTASGAFTLSLSLALPKPQSSTQEFKIVLWGEDQDHNPYDFSVSIALVYGDGPRGR